MLIKQNFQTILTDLKKLLQKNTKQNDNIFVLPIASLL